MEKDKNLISPAQIIPLPHKTNTKVTESVTATIAPTQELGNNGFNTIRQGTGTNLLTKLRAGKDMTVDKMGTATITKDGYELTIPNYNNLQGLKTTTHQLLDKLTIILTESGAKSPTVYLSVDDFIKTRGLKDRKEARKQLVSDLDCLLHFSCTWTENRNGQKIPYAGMNVTDNWIWADKKKTIISFTFTKAFFELLSNYNIMPYPAQLQKINNHKNPNSYYLGRKIAELKNMNLGKINDGTISVKTLLDNAPGISSYRDVMSKSRALTREIIEPFERDMNALEDLGVFHWGYCHSKGTPLTEEEQSNLTYSVFENLYVYIDWANYPARQLRQEEAKRKKKAK